MIAAVYAREQLIHVSRFKRRPPRRIEINLLWGQRPQLAADLLKSHMPGYGYVFVLFRIPAHGMRQTPLFLEIMVGPGFKFGERMCREEGTIGAPVGKFPTGSLGTIFAEFQRMRLGRLAPSATDTHVAVGLVLMRQKGWTRERNMLPKENATHRLRRTPSTCCGFAGCFRWFVSRVGSHDEDPRFPTKNQRQAFLFPSARAGDDGHGVSWHCR
ncbi:hypothetical protein FBZ99_11044 [Rhizobium sp. ERR 1071]|nr:hypothetical protein FBZ99_11044 [Rhizobium sp. ERR1071]